MIVNIWTHHLGSILYCLVPLYGYAGLRSRYNEAPELDFTALTIYFLGVTTCFVLSTLYVWHIVSLFLADKDQFSRIHESQQGGLEARKRARPPWNRIDNMVINGTNRLLWLLLFSRSTDTLLHYGRLKGDAVSNAC